MKKTYDLNLFPDNRIWPMDDGFFKKNHELVFGIGTFDEGEYALFESDRAFYRVERRYVDDNVPTNPRKKTRVKTFLKKAGAKRISR